MPHKYSVGCVDIGFPEERLVREVLSSGWVSPGPMVAEFERRFAKAHDAGHAIMVNSGTDALRIALATLKEVHDWQDGDEVIVPAITFVATVNIILQCGLKPVFIDVHPDTFNLDETKIAKVRTERTRAIIPVHLFGQMANVYEIKRIAPDLKMIEDSCETMGTRLPNGASCGSIGDIGCFSTYACHLIVTGVGGIAVTSNPEYEQIMRSYANHGRDPYFLGGYKQETKNSAELVKRRFLYHRVGYSARVSEFEAALGIAQLEKLPAIIAHRQENAARLNIALESANLRNGGALQLPRHNSASEDHAFMMYPIVIHNENIDRDELCLYLEERGVETRPLMPLLTQPVYKKMWGDISEDYPIAHYATTRGFYIGCHQLLTPKDLSDMAKIVMDGVKACTRKRIYAAA